jgi:hypothetical protein
MRFSTYAFLLLATFPQVSFADGDKYERKYKVEACELIHDKKFGNCATLDYILKVDYRKRIVAMGIYHQGEFKGNIVLQGCNFFDAENWYCPDGAGSVSYASGALLMKVQPEVMTLKFTQVK